MKDRIETKNDIATEKVSKGIAHLIHDAYI